MINVDIRFYHYKKMTDQDVEKFGAGEMAQ